MKQQPQLNALIGIRPGQGGNAPLTPEHKRFQALLQKIDKARERLTQWNQQMPVFASAYALRVQPAVDALHARRRAWAFELEQILLSRKWAKADAQTISDIICDISQAQLGSLDDQANDDPEWKALLARHAEPEGPDATPEQIEELADAFERILGLDDEERYAAPNPRKHSGKTASAAARRAEEDARRISQTAREVYRKLAAALHPDRTPATASDEERRQRTDAMARANAAYEAGDLLALLALQLQIEQIDASHAAQVTSEQVRHFNKVLAEQLAELEAEINGRQDMLCMSYGLAQSRRIDPLKLDAVLRSELRDVEAANKQLDHERRMLRGDPTLARAYLKQERQMRRMLDDRFRF